ncbi:HAAS signaling domain-containing protein [Hamadaea tsunoensis]|uniref:HAAS signaling domain-containing protein n=1 Tax=Hamadaea tsunoensis TaxID=53368 RepID=UPI0003F6D7CC|nr:hypothetical protein [Hamadaea tsunoensis]
MNEDIARYTAAVTAALSDLPVAQREELLEDLPAHLAEVASEGGSLVDRLGTPTAYAAELRATLAPVPRGHRFTVEPLLARWRPVDRRLGPLFGHERFTDFAVLLRPAWWILRGYFAAFLLAAPLGGGGPQALIPRLGSSLLGGLVLTAGCVLGSLWLGRTTAVNRRRGLRVFGGIATAVTALFGFVYLLNADGNLSGSRPAPAYAEQSSTSNVVLVDAQGHLVTGVRVLDLDTGDWAAVRVYTCDDGGIAAGLLSQDDWSWRYPALAQYCARLRGQNGFPTPDLSATGSPAGSPAPGPSVSPSAGAGPSAGPSASPSPGPSATR